MNRDTFMSELEYLLQDIPEAEKAEALQYYRDYFDEAGPERESAIVEEFGSPERIAAIIRSDLSGNLEDGGAFTERGYEDERFKDPNHQMAQRYDLPEEREKPGGGSRPNRRMDREDIRRLIKLILLALLVFFIIPPVLGVAGGAVGLLAGIVGVLAVVGVGVGVATLVLFVLGAGLAILGIFSLAANLVSGLLFLGAGVMLVGFGFLFLVVAVLFYGKFLPFLVRLVTDFLSGLFHGRRAKES